MSQTAREIYLPYQLSAPDDAIRYAAGFPSYPGNFSRDVFIAGLLATEPSLLASQLEVAARYQGQAPVANSGEEVGKIHHQIPGVDFRHNSRNTTYNACDTTALFLIAADVLANIDQAALSEFVKRNAAKLEKAAAYILRHLDKDNLFTELPPEGADGFSLRVTYWKDSILPNPNGKIEPHYPVIYPQPHFIAARGLLGASRLLRDDWLAAKADQMFQAGISASMTEDGYLVYRDAQDELWQPSSDELHSLAYIPTIYVDLLPLEAIAERGAEHLATPFGYLCTPLEIGRQLTDRYHGEKVWVFEQAKIHYGAAKFGLKDTQIVAAAVAPHINQGQELLGVVGSQIKRLTAVPEGNNRQLWSVAAAEYFAGRSALRQHVWL